MPLWSKELSKYQPITMFSSPSVLFLDHEAWTIFLYIHIESGGQFKDLQYMSSRQESRIKCGLIHFLNQNERSKASLTGR